MNGINPPTEEIKVEIQKDIKIIEDAIKSNDKDKMQDINCYIDGKYHTCIFDWGKSMYAYDSDLGFNTDLLGIKSLKYNLNAMKANLSGYALGLNSYLFPEKAPDSSHQIPGFTFNVNNSNNNTNSINLSISFKQARQQVEEMNSLNQEQTDEIIEKIDELETISKEKTPKKKKWEKIKPILAFALDKGVDIAIMLWSLALQHGLGQ